MSLTVVRFGTDASEDVAAGQVVKRAVGFGRDGYVAEVTVQCGDGYATVRGEGLSPDFALARAKAAARSKLTARKRATGFAATGYRETTTKAEYIGFCKEAA